MRGFVFAVGLVGCGAAWGQQAQVAAPKAAESVTVTATARGMAGVNDAATSVVVLSKEKLAAAPGFALDDALHQVAGFQLFRRTSSWTANPTSQGVSLRGLGSTAASRTLVVSDEVPLNDAFGGWVHWNEVPVLAVGSVTVMRGGASDLYGSSAVGGVLEVVPERPVAKGLRVEMDAAGASESTALGDALVSGGGRLGEALGAVSVVSTGGYVAVAPEVRGAVDVPVNVVSEAARVEGRRVLGAGVAGFLRGNVLNEVRGNGTPLQTNAARLWRYQGGADWSAEKSAAAVRVFGSREGYRQSFTSTAADRNSEKLTKLQRVPSDEMGFVAQGSRVLGGGFSAALGVDARDVRATDEELATATGVLTSTSARQRAVGGYADAVWQRGGWQAAGSVRVDSFRTFDARQFVGSSVSALPVISELVASPRVGLVRRVGAGVSVTGTAFRAFRGPTLNELYRTSQVGSQTTLANNGLLAERATGFEFGGEWERATVGRVRATYFWTEVNRPVSSVLLSTNLYQRENLGQIRSRGVMVEAATVRRRGVDFTLGYQYAVATVTAFRAQPGLVGRWTPEVPRESLTGTMNWAVRRVAGFHAIASYQGREYDDALNTFVLHGYARVDLSADRELWRGLRVFASAQNVLDRRIEAGRTPVLTLAAPRVVEAGLRWGF